MKKYVDKDGLQDYTTKLVNKLTGKYLTPDDYSGTDTQKINLCLNALKDTGGTIIIDRQYTITGNLINKLNTDSAKKKYIQFLGIGSNAIIDMQENSFYAGIDNAACGGLHFFNIDFRGTSIFANTNQLIRMFFINCRFNGFTYVIYGQGITQSLYFNQCYFNEISEYVFANISNGVWDIAFDQCICENGGGFYNGDLPELSNGNYQVRIRDCCIEGMSKSCIKLSKVTNSFTVEGCYFEAAQPIDLSNAGGNGIKNIAIRNNYFQIANNKPAIKMPDSNTTGFKGVIGNNTCNPDTNYLAVIEGEREYSSKCQYVFYGNTGQFDNIDYYREIDSSVDLVRSYTSTANKPAVIPLIRTYIPLLVFGFFQGIGTLFLSVSTNSSSNTVTIKNLYTGETYSSDKISATISNNVLSITTYGTDPSHFTVIYSG